MSEEPSELERLISRCLDGENSPSERRKLERLIDADPAAADLYEDYAAIDEKVGAALRASIGHPACPVRTLSFRERYARVGMLAAAACLAVLLWFSPRQTVRDSDPAIAAHAPSASWFAPMRLMGDTLVERPARLDGAVRWVGQPRTEWIVIPTEREGEYMVIEVDKVVAQTLRERRDF